MTLNDLKPNQSAIVKNIRSKGAIKRRIIDMGITPGITVRMIKAAPFGDPIEINVRGYELSIRKKEAMEIEVFMEGDEKNEAPK